MKTAKIFLPLMLLFVLLPPLTKQAHACTCVEYGVPACAAYWRADAVFAGIITDIKKLPEPSPGDMPKALLHFVIEDAYRGITGSDVDVATLSGTSCDIEFEKGERLLVYAYRDKASGRLEIHPCTRLVSLSDAEEDLKYIDSLRQKKFEQSILGKLKRNSYEPLIGVKVTAEGSGHKFEAVTGDEGTFKLDLPQSGNYTFRASVPFAAALLMYSGDEPIKVSPTDELTVIEYKVNVPEGQCLYKEFNVFKVDLHATAEISGRVRDKSGRPFSPAGYVYLVNAEDDEDKSYTKIGSAGEFKFEGVAVGRYFLVVNPYDSPPDEDDAPYSRTFYPGVSTSNQATLIPVVEGAKLENIDFRLRTPLKERVITGKVLWADGRVASDAHVSLYGGAQNKYVQMVRTDDQGNFSMKVYGEFQYEIKAQRMGEISGRGEMVKIPSTNKPKPFRLIIKPER